MFAETLEETKRERDSVADSKKELEGQIKNFKEKVQVEVSKREEAEKAVSALEQEILQLKKQHRYHAHMHTYITAFFELFFRLHLLLLII